MTAYQVKTKALSIILTIAMLMTVVQAGGIAAFAADNDQFIKDSNGISLKYQVISEAEKTVMVLENGNSGAVTIPATVENGGATYSVTEIGKGAFKSLQSSLTSVVIPASVTSIEEEAFYYCTKLTKISIPASVTSIGVNAFFNCTALSTVTLSAPSNLKTIGLGAFEECTSLAKIVIPASVTSIGDRAFIRCTSLSTVTLSTAGNLDSIGAGAFYGCAKLTKMVIPASVTSIGNEAFSRCVKLSTVSFDGTSKLDSIGQLAFESTALTQIAIPASVTSIDGMAFIMCTGLTNIDVNSQNQNYISADGILFNKTKTDLVIYPAGKKDTVYSVPASVQNICDYSFVGCINLASISIPAGVTSVGNYVFAYCDSLKNIIFAGSTPPTIGDSAFLSDDETSYPIAAHVPSAQAVTDYNAAFSNYVSSDPQQITFDSESISLKVGDTFAADNNGVSIKYEVTSVSPKTVKVIANTPLYSGSVEIPASVIAADENSYSVTELGEQAFYNCTNLIKVEIPSGVTKIDQWAFESCPKLTDISLPDSVAEIGQYAFKGDSGLTKIDLPDELTSVGKCAFQGCSSLENATIPSGVTEISQQMFDGCKGLKTVSIPDSVVLISDMAFMDCSNLTSIVIPSKVETIGQASFMGCSQLTNVMVKGNIHSIGDMAFYQVPKLTDITFDSPTPPTTVGSNIFDGDTFPINAHVPSGAKLAYETAFKAYTESDPVQLKFEESSSTLSTPTGLMWDSKEPGKAEWDKVDNDANGYLVQLKKDGIDVGTSVTVTSETFYDFSAVIAANGSGAYTFTITAKGDSISTENSAESPASAAYTFNGSDENTKNIITGFLTDSVVKSQTVEYGTDFASLNLPKKLQVVGDEITGLWVKVTKWICSTYDSTVAGTYRLSPVLDNSYVDSGYVDSGYVLGSGVSLPEITVTVAASSSTNSNNHSDTSNSKTSSTTTTSTTVTKVDTTGNTATVTTKPDSVTTSGNTTDIQVTVPSITTDNTDTSTNGSTVDETKKTAVTINVPTQDIVQQLTAKKDVDLTITVPSDVAKDANANLAVTINANKEILEAAKANLDDVTIRIKDADTQQLAYSWTFKGADLAKSSIPIADINISMSIHLTTEVPKVNVITPMSKGLVLSFDHSGLLPSVASVKFSALEKGFKPGQTLYFYYYNPTTKQIESLGKDSYTVDADGYVTVQIYHCSDYVLLPNAARSLTLDTKIYTMAPKQSYEIGVKLMNMQNTTVKVYSSTKGAASITKLKNGNYKVTGLKVGLTYVMFDVYDEKGKLISKGHASVRLILKSGVNPSGNSWRQTAIF